jgi:hypothetical protein
MSKFLTGDPLVSPHTELGEELWTFHQAVVFSDDAGALWRTANTFVSDGASIPPPLRVLLGNSFRTDYIRPAGLHDYFYRTWAELLGGTGEAARTARLRVDRMFRDALIEDGVHPVKAWLIYSGVRSGGWVAWKRHAARKEG